MLGPLHVQNGLLWFSIAKLRVCSLYYSKVPYITGRFIELLSNDISHLRSLEITVYYFEPSA